MHDEVLSRAAGNGHSEPPMSLEAVGGIEIPGA